MQPQRRRSPLRVTTRRGGRDRWVAAVMCPSCSSAGPRTFGPFASGQSQCIEWFHDRSRSPRIALCHLIRFSPCTPARPRVARLQWESDAEPDEIRDAGERVRAVNNSSEGQPGRSSIHSPSEVHLDRGTFSRSDADTIAWGLAQRTPDNQLDIWQRLFSGLANVLRDTRPHLAQPLCEMNLAFYRVRRFPCPSEALSKPVTPKESWDLPVWGSRSDRITSRGSKLCSIRARWS